MNKIPRGIAYPYDSDHTHVVFVMLRSRKNDTCMAMLLDEHKCNDFLVYAFHEMFDYKTCN